MTFAQYEELLVQHCKDKKAVQAYQMCSSRRQVYEWMCHPRYAETLLRSMQEGWGPSAEDIKRLFSPFVNDLYTVMVHTAGNAFINTQLWCDSNDVRIDDDIRLAVLINCKGRLRLKPWQVLQLYIDAESSLEIDAPDTALALVNRFKINSLAYEHNLQILHAEG